MKRKVLREHEESKKRMVWLDLFRVRRNLRAVFLGVMLMVIQEFSGINAISYYMGTLLHRSGFSSLDSVYWSMLPGFCGILGTLSPVLFMDHFGRRIMDDDISFDICCHLMTEIGVFAGFFGCITFLRLLYCLLLMPETKGKTLEQLNEVFEMPSKKLVAKNIAMIDLLHLRFGNALGW
ncbi:myo-inositol:H+ symporter/ sugar:H+ symporter [Galdieria sulphuraria]|uniref:Myo-inositol:H+ symporter/ sugar:H+ symporter n=1 Tax=Galdieria sulphuraria TaxID=130081 RepID=M2XRY5_GALSU|nr:myo-inositol:H+ symporter/ sugar:H+ symporter [Galdieria sulphuraria]EME26194.1 myo-inositol:H+ symporter/ sugar:H+ symporter [Galdieria sulphuraria]|eukprot:XP_005702714.1 myo-inositol:H+ symporter/ sugar:H+ symporter [Galdieria sulphuraria]